MDSTPPPTAATAASRRAERRLRSKLPDGEAIVAWSQGWVSRDGRLRMVAARTLDYVVVTDRRLYLFTTGFFTRRPRRCVYAQSLARLRAAERPAGRGRHLRLESPDHRPLLIDLRRRARSDTLADEVLARTRADQETP